MPSNRIAFTIVEALVATTIVGIASAALAVSLAASSHLRSRAAARIAAAQIAAQRTGFLSARACAAPDTDGVTAAARGTEVWRARRSAGGWTYSDSITVAPAFTLHTAGTVACRP